MAKTNCGVYGIYSITHTIENVYNCIDSLKQMQHRGQESCGISFINDRKIEIYKNVGLVKDVFNNYQPIKTNRVTGHVRYSTSGTSKLSTDSRINEAQPLLGHNKKLGDFTLAHNGNIPNITYDNDSITVLRFIESSEEMDWISIFKKILIKYERAYCFIILTHDGLYALRDKYGVRPLSIGKLLDSYCIVSETCGLSKYELVRDILPGEIVSLTEKNNKKVLKSEYILENKVEAKCLFEYIYFMKGSSIDNGMLINDVRYQFGLNLAKKEDLDLSIKDDFIVTGIPNTGTPYGLGYSKFLDIDYKQVIKKRLNSARTFILENNEKRNAACKNKYLYDADFIKDKKLILLDDSLVRGNTIKNIIIILRNLGAKEIHLRIGSPRVKNICYYGVDIPTKEELIANNYSLDGIRDNVNADSLKYLELEDIRKIYPDHYNNFCTGCFNNDYKHTESNNLEW